MTLWQWLKRELAWRRPRIACIWIAETDVYGQPWERKTYVVSAPGRGILFDFPTSNVRSGYRTGGVVR